MDYLKKSSAKIVVISILTITVISVLLFLKQQDNVRIGFGTKDEFELENGTYSNEELNLTGQYAVVSISGEGSFQLLQDNNKIVENLKLDDFVYQDVKKRAPQMSNQILYEEGEKVNFDNFETILIDGNESFIVKLIKR